MLATILNSDLLCMFLCCMQCEMVVVNIFQKYSKNGLQPHCKDARIGFFGLGYLGAPPQKGAGLCDKRERMTTEYHLSHILNVAILVQVTDQNCRFFKK